jgi:hypothetical protein
MDAWDYMKRLEHQNTGYEVKFEKEEIIVKGDGLREVRFPRENDHVNE